MNDCEELKLIAENKRLIEKNSDILRENYDMQKKLFAISKVLYGREDADIQIEDLEEILTERIQAQQQFHLRGEIIERLRKQIEDLQR